MNSLFYITILFLPVLLQAAPLEINKPWPVISDPVNFGRYYTHQFTALPLKGRVKNRNKIWSGDYWALNKGNINYRWYGDNHIGFNLNSPTREQVERMKVGELATLSPAEKYDLFTGRYDYPLKNQVAQISSPTAKNWEGICHGWASASINHVEPMPKLMTNPQGIEIPFGSTDIKALLSYFYAYGFQTPAIQMGSRCYPNGDGCLDDMNAGAFHIILGNRLGLQGESFIADIEARGEVWNNPAYSYRSEIQRETRPGTVAAPGTVKLIRIKTDFYFADSGENNWRPVNDTNLQVINSRSYEYDLEIDPSGNIIGGEWISRSRPDFLWLKPRPFRYTGLLFKLGELLDD